MSVFCYLRLMMISTIFLSTSLYIKSMEKPHWDPDLTHHRIVEVCVFPFCRETIQDIDQDHQRFSLILQRHANGKLMPLSRLVDQSERLEDTAKSIAATVGIDRGTKQLRVLGVQDDNRRDYLDNPILSVDYLITQPQTGHSEQTICKTFYELEKTNPQDWFVAKSHRTRALGAFIMFMQHYLQSNSITIINDQVWEQLKKQSLYPQGRVKEFLKAKNSNSSGTQSKL